MIGLDLYTHHADPGGLCSDTVGIYGKAPSGLTAGLMKNSECRVGAWGGYTWETNTLKLGPVRTSAALTVGGIVGYRNQPLMPLIAPSIKLGVFRATYLPRAPGAQSSGVHLSIEFEH